MSVERTAGGAMGKMVECAQVDSSSGCKQVIHGKDEAEVMRKTAEHAKEHGLKDVTPELQAKVRAAIRDE
jgi:predicted small metal-binding protein